MLDSALDVKDGASPFYTKDSTNPPSSELALKTVPSGVSSGFDSDTVQGIQAVTAKVSGPNKLVATDKNGKLPLGIMPTGGATPGVLQYVTGTYANLKASPPTNIAMGIATDQGVAGALYFYTNNPLAGDSGWVFIGGS